MWLAGPPANPSAGYGNLLWAQVALHLSGWGTCLLTVALSWWAAEEGGTRLQLLTEQTVADINRKRGVNPPVRDAAGAQHCTAPQRSAEQHSGAAALLPSLCFDAPSQCCARLCSRRRSGSATNRAAAASCGRATSTG